jgi:hypothetical protein
VTWRDLSAAVSYSRETRRHGPLQYLTLSSYVCCSVSGQSHRFVPSLRGGGCHDDVRRGTQMSEPQTWTLQSSAGKQCLRYVVVDR